MKTKQARISSKLHHELKIYCAKHDLKITDCLNDLIRRKLGLK